MTTPAQIVQDLHKRGIHSASWQMGGNCGAIGVIIGTDQYILITPNNGPYSYGDEETDYGSEWLACIYHDEIDGSWFDSEGVKDGTAIITPSDIPCKVERMIQVSDDLWG